MNLKLKVEYVNNTNQIVNEISNDRSLFKLSSRLNICTACFSNILVIFVTETFHSVLQNLPVLIYLVEL
jgi:hypothetical protein